MAGVRKRINVYDAFIEGAKEGFNTAIRIIPYLVAMLVAIAVFRASGAMDVLIGSIRWLIASLGVDARFVDALPTAIMKPLSGSGARGMMVDAMNTYGADSFVGRLSCIFQGSTDTTFLHLSSVLWKCGNTQYSPRSCMWFIGRFSGSNCCNSHCLLLFLIVLQHYTFIFS